MHPDAQKLLELTLTLSEALARGETDECVRLLSRRGRFLADLAGRYADAPAPPELEAAFATLRRLDRDIADRLEIRRDELGRELVRMGAQKNRETSTVPRRFDYKA